uniref:Uncharacterized protein n=1 Tax=Oryza meridionalis TaxID=40149 RepID=A0A0E0EM08_9ORYZ
MDLPVLDVLAVAGAAAARLALDGGVSASCPPHRSAFPLPRTVSGVGVLLVVVVARRRARMPMPRCDNSGVVLRCACGS